MYHWRWSNGEPYYKSAREVQRKEPSQENENSDENYSISYDTRENAINQSLADNNFTEIDMIDITNSMFSRSQNETSNRREYLDNKIANREAIFQRGVNPFMNQTSYVNDVVVRDMFLKPVCTTHDKIKMDDKDNNNNQK
jgi:hypothetical protein